MRYQIIPLAREARIIKHDNTYSTAGRVRYTFGSLLPRLDGGLVVDAGCSRGETTAELAKIYPKTHVVGVDFNVEMIAIARETFPHLEFREGDFYRADQLFAPGSVAMFVAMNNIWHIQESLDPEDMRWIVGNVGTTIATGGYLLVSGDREREVLQKTERGFVREEDPGFRFTRQPLVRCIFEWEAAAASEEGIRTPL